MNGVYSYGCVKLEQFVQIDISPTEMDSNVAIAAPLVKDAVLESASLNRLLLEDAYESALSKDHLQLLLIPYTATFGLPPRPAWDALQARLDCFERLAQLHSPEFRPREERSPAPLRRRFFLP